MGAPSGWPGVRIRSLPGRSVTMSRRSGRKAKPHGVSSPSATVSSLNAWRSLSKTEPIGGAPTPPPSTFAFSASSRISTTSDRICRSSRVALKDGISVPGRPSRMLRARSASVPPNLQVSSSRLEARPPARPSPWQLAQTSAESLAAAPSPTKYATEGCCGSAAAAHQATSVARRRESASPYARVIRPPLAARPERHSPRRHLATLTGIRAPARLRRASIGGATSAIKTDSGRVTSDERRDDGLDSPKHLNTNTPSEGSCGGSPARIRRSGRRP
jgi:hypothetical protein